MEIEGLVPLVGREIHGFDTSADLDFKKLTEDASKRWLRPNEVYAILSNYTLFKIQPQPVDVPSSGSLLLFDRKVLRNFRKDGHNWRKKKDGKTVQEAHEKLKIGNEERIHVYYARNEDDLNFYRRCYWLLDRNLERIVLVHYRQTSEETAYQLLPMLAEPKDAFHLTTSPIASSSSATGSNISEIPACRVLTEEINSAGDYAIYAGSQLSPSGNLTERGNHEFSLNEIEGLCWNDMMKEPSYIDAVHKNGYVTFNDQDIQYQLQNTNYHDTLDEEMPSLPQPNCPFPAIFSDDFVQSVDGYFSQMDASRTCTQFGMANASAQELTDGRASLAGDQSTDVLIDNVYPSQINPQFNNPAGSSHDSGFRASDSLNALPLTIDSSCQDHVYNIVDISPAYAYSMEQKETKIIVVGYFNESHRHLEDSNVYCIFGDRCILAEKLKAGVYRIMTLTQNPGLIEFYLCIDGHTTISKVMNFEFRSLPNTPSNSVVTSPEVYNELPAQRDSEVWLRLTHLLFSTTNTINVLSSRISPNSMKDAKKFMSLTTMENQWKHFLDANKNNSRPPANHELFELVLKDKLQEWLLLRVAEGCRTTVRDKQGQGVIHLCAILDYAWAIRMFSLSGLPLDFRDVHGWTALHWAAYYGREKTVAALLSAGANPSLVADPSPEYLGGCTAADLASQEGYEGLGAYLAEKGLRAHFLAMALSGNAAAPMRQGSIDPMSYENIDGEILSEQELCLKDSLAAYRNAADAADRIQSAFRERSLKQQMKAARLTKPEQEAESIVAALKIQKAFRNYNRRKLMKAAIRIQGTFRTWQARKNFLNLRRQVIKIQAIFRGHLERRQYHKIIWSVGVLEKAVLRWRMKRKGLRGLQAETAAQAIAIEEENCVEEEFFRVSREQAEERVKRSVVRVQAMFRSYRAQQDYRRMKLAYSQAELEYGDFADPSRQL